MTSTPAITVVAVLAAFAVAALVAAALRGIVLRRVGAAELVSAERRAALQARAARLMRLVTVVAFGLAGLVALSLILQRLNIAAPVWTPRQIRDWMTTSGVRMVLIVIGAILAVRLAHLAIEQLEYQLGRSHERTDLEWQRRSATLSGILSRLVSVSVTFVALLMILQQLAIDVMPVLTGAGIAGLAIGFGAQNLVRDVISGFFIILEDQVRVGDVARINNIAGRVEQINLRTIVIRDVDGAVQVFPNGTITALANLSKQFAYAVVDVRAAYTEDIDRVLQLVRDIGAGMRAEPEWSALLPEPLEVNGVESFADGFATVRMRFRTPPLMNGKVAAELRRRLMTAFTHAMIRPFR
jgi:small conductance mechanosensitive channel